MMGAEDFMVPLDRTLGTFKTVDQFQPGNYVKIVLLDINYKGRLLEVRHKIGCTAYYVQYVDDRAEFKCGEFYGDEIELMPR
jgi:hypothetical protein